MLVLYLAAFVTKRLDHLLLSGLYKSFHGDGHWSRVVLSLTHVVGEMVSNSLV